MQNLARGSFVTNLLNSLSSHIAVLNSQGDIIEVNNAWKQFAQENDCPYQSSYLGTNYLTVCENSLKITYDEDIEQVVKGLKSVLCNEVQSFQFEYPCHSPNEERWFCLRVTNFNYENETYVVTSHENITARKQAEQELVESHELYRLLYENSLDAILLTKADGRILAANPAATRMFGKTEANIRETGRDGLMDINDLRLMDAWNERDSTGKFQGELTGLRGDGTRFPMDVTTSIYKDHEGKNRASIILRDISESKKAAEQIEYHSKLLRNVNDVIIGTDENFAITYWNHVAERTFGWKPEEVIGQSVIGILRTKFANDSLENSIQSITKTGVWKGEVIQYTKDDQPVNIDASILALRDHTGRITGFVSANRNITERKLVEQRFRDLIEAAPDAIILVNSSGRINLVNQQAEVMFGHTREELAGQSIALLIPERFHDSHVIHIDKYFTSPSLRPTSNEMELVARRKDGSEFPIEIGLSPLREKDGSIVVIASVRDITERKETDAIIRASEEKWHTLFNILPVGVSVLDPNKKIIEMNDALLEILEISREGLLAGEYSNREYLKKDGTSFTWATLPSSVAMNEQKTVKDVEICIVTENGGKIWTNVSAAPLNLPNASSSVVIVTANITDRKQAEEELMRINQMVKRKNKELEKAYEREQYLARTDPLTDVSNHRHFITMATYEFVNATRYRRPLSILLFDIDKFKKINDTLGHPFGDKMLRHIAQTANDRLRESDILARYGGEEFVLLLPNTNAEEAHIVAEDIRKSIAASGLESDKGLVSVTISLGISEILPKGDTLEKLIQRADDALYKAKRDGRNRTVIHS